MVDQPNSPRTLMLTQNSFFYCCYQCLLFSNCLHCDHDQGRWRARLTVSQFYELLVQKIIKGFKMYLKTISQIQLFYTIFKKKTRLLSPPSSMQERERKFDRNANEENLLIQNQS